MNSLALANIISAFSSFRVAVVGDLMLDRYIWGRAARISEEAPVPVVTVARETQVPGGAANVIRNVLGLTAAADAFGVIGTDAAGDELFKLLAEAGAGTAGIVRAGDRPTTVKTRVIAGNQQVCRIDRETVTPVTPAVQGKLLKQILTAIRTGRVQAVIFEDYAKGLLSCDMMQEIADAAARRRVITVLDPHPSHPFEVKGLTMMTPNRAEAFGLAGVYYQAGVYPLTQDEPLLKVSRLLRRRWAVRHLLVTLGAGGMALFSGTTVPLHIPTRAREIFDVSGAGDTVTATCTLALLAGTTAAAAAQLGNCAAGVVVGKIGTVPITAPELKDAVKREA